MLKRSSLLNRIKALFPRIPPSAPDPSLRIPAEAPVAGASKQEAARRIKAGFSYRREIVTSLRETPPPLPENTYTSPLMVAGTAIGAIQAASDETAWTEREFEILDGVAALLALHLENLNHPERHEPQAPG